MKNLMVVGSQGGITVGQNLTRYFPFTGDESGATTEANCQARIRDSLTWANLRANVTGNSFASGNNTTITARVNGADDTTLQLVINGGTTGEVEDLTGSISLVTGDLANWEVTTPNVAGTFTAPWIACTLEGSVGIMMTHGGSRVTLAASTTYYSHPDGTLIGTSWTTEAWAQMATRETVTIDRLRGVIASIGTGGSLTIRTRKNGADGNGVIVWTGTTGEQEDTSNTDSFADTDLLNLSLANTNTAGTTSLALTQLRHNGTQSFLAATNGAANTLGFGATRYLPVEGDPEGGTTTEANIQIDAIVTRIVKNMRVYVSANSINGTTTFDLRKDGTNTGVGVSFGASTSGLQEDLTSSATFTAAEEMSTRAAAAGTMNTMTYRIIQYTQEDEAVALDMIWAEATVIDETYDEEHNYDGFVSWVMPDDVDAFEVAKEWTPIDETYDLRPNFNGWLQSPMRDDNPEVPLGEFPEIDEAFDEEHDYSGLTISPLSADFIVDEIFWENLPQIDETFYEEHDYSGFTASPLFADIVIDESGSAVESPAIDETYFQVHSYGGWVQSPMRANSSNITPVEIPVVDERYYEEHDYSGFMTWQTPTDVIVDITEISLHSLRRRLALNSSRDNQVLHVEKQDYNLRGSRR